MAIVAAVAVVFAAGVAFLALRPSTGAKAPKARSAEELLQAMSGSVSPIVTYDISGKLAPAGLAWVIEDKVMVANCQMMPPGVQLMVNAGTKQVAARVTLADESLGLCKILTDAYVGEPLAVNGTLPAVGAKVFAAALGAKGELGLREATVTKVVDLPHGKAIQASPAAAAGRQRRAAAGRAGKVVAVATLQADGNVLHRVIPAAWLAENRPRFQEPRPYQGDSGTAAPRRITAGVLGGRRGLRSVRHRERSRDQGDARGPPQRSRRCRPTSARVRKARRADGPAVQGHHAAHAGQVAGRGARGPTARIISFCTAAFQRTAP